MTTDVTEEKRVEIPSWARPIHHALFGPQNEKIENLIDQFFRLSLQARTGVLIGSALTVVTLIFILLGTYFRSLYRLEKELDESYKLLAELKTLQYQAEMSRVEFEHFKNYLAQSSQNFTFISFIDRTSKEIGLNPTNFPAQPPQNSFPSNHPLYGTFKIEELTFDVNNISLKQLIEYLTILQKKMPILNLRSLRLKTSIKSKSYLDVRIGLQAIVSEK